MDAIHGVHPYPCKFPAHVARAHLVNGGVVLDPFCGSGTTLVEAARRGCDAIGIDCNPVATLVARVKLLDASSEFVDEARRALTELDGALAAGPSDGAQLHDFAGRDHWFPPAVQRDVAFVLDLINGVERAEIAAWLKLALSGIANRVSRQDGETRYARVERDVGSGVTLSLFRERAARVLDVLVERGPLRARGVVVHADVMRGIPLRDSSVDQVVTSPPYANTMDYYLYHKQRMNLLGYRYKDVQRAEIGSRWEYSSLKRPRAKWERDYAFVLGELRRVLRRGCSAIVVIGDSRIAGERVDGGALTCELGARAGLAAEVLESAPMAGRSRSFNTSFQRSGKREHVVRLTRT